MRNNAGDWILKKALNFNKMLDRNMDKKYFPEKIASGLNISEKDKDFITQLMK